MFSAAIYLRFKREEVKRPFKIPGGKVGICIVAGFGLLSSTFAIIIGCFTAHTNFCGQCDEIRSATDYRYNHRLSCTVLGLSS